jgi:hypothetical protein
MTHPRWLLNFINQPPHSSDLSATDLQMLMFRVNFPFIYACTIEPGYDFMKGAQNIVSL